jgi:hypothetical protein
VQPGQLGGHRDGEQPPVQVRPPGAHHSRSRCPATYHRASTASLASSSSRPAGPGARRGSSTRTGPAHSGGPGARAIGLTPSPAGRGGLTRTAGATGTAGATAPGADPSARS